MLSALKAGTVLDSRYEIVAHIGDGGMGSVFKARELGLERFVAVKMLHPSLIGDKEHQERFKREGAVLSKLEHPHILQCFRFGVWNGMFPYIAMEYVQGKSLSSLIAENGRLDSERAIALGKQICRAMEHAHRHKIVHRDLKPANIMVLQDASGNESIRVLDFGLAKVVAEAGRASQHLTNTGDLIGSVYYMSPEQCLGKPCNAVSDVYSLGCLLYEALTGSPPLMADTPVGLMYLHANSIPELISRKLPQADLPAGLDAVLARSLEKDPARRFQSMEQFEVDLDLVASGRGAEVTISAPRKVKVNGKGRSVSLLTVLGIIVLSGLGLAILLRSRAPVGPPFAINKSGDAGRVVLRHLDPYNFYYDPTMVREERILKIKEWLKKYGGIDLQGRVTTLAMLSSIYFEGGAEDRKQASYYGRQMTDALALLMRDETVIGGLKSRDMETTMELVRVVLCNEHGSLAGRQTLLRDFGKLVPDRLKDSVNSAIAGIFSSCGLYSEELAVRRKVLHPGLQDQIQCGYCLYRQGKFAEGRRTVGTFSRDAYAFYSEDPQHHIAQILLEMDMVPEASTYLDFCLPRRVATSPAMMRVLGERTVCTHPSVHARTEALILYLRKDYRGANHRLVSALAGAPPSQRLSYRQELLPLAVRTAEQGHLDVSPVLDLALKEATIADVGWILRVESTCRSSNQQLADRLLARALQLIAINRQHSPSDPQWCTLAGGALIAANRSAETRELLTKVLAGSVEKQEAVWLRIVLVESLLVLRCFDDAEYQLSLVTSDVFDDGELKDEIGRHVLRLQAKLALARGRLPESAAIFEKLHKIICNKPIIGLQEKIEVLDAYAETCRLLKRSTRVKELEQEARLLLPERCRGPWRTWRPLLVEEPRRPIYHFR
ncbi:MAG: serine/threonine protein kinase [Candidatus Obscuribacterales bacterium]|nr:serine/threonine protein kinase [Candidatus Obscuribacterales bacterium]